MPYINMKEMNRQSRFHAGYRKLGVGALGWPRGMVWGGRGEGGSGLGTRVHPWQIQNMIFNNTSHFKKSYSGWFQLEKRVWWGFHFAKIWGTLIEYFGINTYIMAEINCYVPRVCVCVCVCVCCTQSCLTLCDPVAYSPPDSSIHRILQARMLEWVAISYSRGSSPPRDRTCISCVFCIGRQVQYLGGPGTGRMASL